MIKAKRLKLVLLLLSLGGCFRDEPTKVQTDARQPTVVLPSSGSGPGGTWHFATAQGGLSSGNGATLDSAWTLTYAFSSGNTHLAAGDTVWLMSGTYVGPFTVSIGGNATSGPIVYRQLPGAVAKIDRSGGIPGYTNIPPALTVQAPYAEFWDFEVLNSSTKPRRDTVSDVNNVSHEWVPNSVWISGQAHHTKFVNLVVHDGGQGIAKDPAVANVTISGCILYNNGWQRPLVNGGSKTDGHGLYLRNSSTTDSVFAYDNIVFDQFGYGIHAYTNANEGYLRNIRIEGNISFNNGTLSRWGTQANLGNLGEPAAENMLIKQNMLYFSPQVDLNAAPNDTAPISLGPNLKYGTNGGGSTSITNYVVGGGTPAIDSGSGWSITDQFAQTPWSPDVIIARRTRADMHRGNITVYSGGGSPSILVNLDSILVPNDSFEVRNAQAFGTVVSSGKFLGGSISIPNDSIVPPRPLGDSTPRQPVTTGRRFSVFVVQQVRLGPTLTAGLWFVGCQPGGIGLFRAQTNSGGTTLQVDARSGTGAWTSVGTFTNDPQGTVHNITVGTRNNTYVRAKSTGANRTPQDSPYITIGPYSCGGR